MAAGSRRPDASPADPKDRQPGKMRAAAALVVANAAVVLTAEFLVRLAVAIASQSLQPFAYGFNRDLALAFDMQRITTPRVYDRGAPDRRYLSASDSGAPRAPENPEMHVAAFGGSTTAGYSCSSAASSWPDELGKVRPEWRVANRGLSGTNSDVAFDQLQILLQRDEAPDLVLWANWINEVDVAFVGLRSNRQWIELVRPDLASLQPAGNGSAIGLWLRGSETLAQLSLGYALFREAVTRLTRNRNAGVAQEGVIDPRLAELAVLNYRLNLEKASDLAKQHGFRLIVVRLPTNWARWEQAMSPENTHFVRHWDSLMVRTLQGSLDLPIIDTHRSYEVREDTAELFCDTVHQTLRGHELLADLIVAGVDSIYSSGRYSDP